MKRDKRVYAPSVIIPVRYHSEELKALDKNRKRVKRSVYIREKSLQVDN